MLCPVQELGGQQPISPAVDIWSLGCITYELVSGTKLFPADAPLSDWRSRVASIHTMSLTSVPATLGPQLRGMLAPSPSSRPPAASLAACTFFQVGYHHKPTLNHIQ